MRSLNQQKFMKNCSGVLCVLMFIWAVFPQSVSALPAPLSGNAVQTDLQQSVDAGASDSGQNKPAPRKNLQPAKVNYLADSLAPSEPDIVSVDVSAVIDDNAPTEEAESPVVAIDNQVPVDRPEQTGNGVNPADTAPAGDPATDSNNGAPAIGDNAPTEETESPVVAIDNQVPVDRPEQTGNGVNPADTAPADNPAADSNESSAIDDNAPTEETESPVAAIDNETPEEETEPVSFTEDENEQEQIVSQEADNPVNPVTPPVTAETNPVSINYSTNDNTGTPVLRQARLTATTFSPACSGDAASLATSGSSSGTSICSITLSTTEENGVPREISRIWLFTLTLPSAGLNAMRTDQLFNRARNINDYVAQYPPVIAPSPVSGLNSSVSSLLGRADTPRELPPSFSVYPDDRPVSFATGFIRLSMPGSTGTAQNVGSLRFIFDPASPNQLTGLEFRDTTAQGNVLFSVNNPSYRLNALPPGQSELNAQRNAGEAAARAVEEASQRVQDLANQAEALQAQVDDQYNQIANSRNSALSILDRMQARNNNVSQAAMAAQEARNFANETQAAAEALRETVASSSVLSANDRTRLNNAARAAVNRASVAALLAETGAEQARDWAISMNRDDVISAANRLYVNLAGAQAVAQLYARRATEEKDNVGASLNNLRSPLPPESDPAARAASELRYARNAAARANAQVPAIEALLTNNQLLVNNLLTIANLPQDPNQDSPDQRNMRNALNPLNQIISQIQGSLTTAQRAATEANRLYRDVLSAAIDLSIDLAGAQRAAQGYAETAAQERDRVQVSLDILNRLRVNSGPLPQATPARDNAQAAAGRANNQVNALLALLTENQQRVNALLNIVNLPQDPNQDSSDQRNTRNALNPALNLLVQIQGSLRNAQTAAAEANRLLNLAQQRFSVVTGSPPPPGPPAPQPRPTPDQYNARLNQLVNTGAIRELKPSSGAERYQISGTTGVTLLAQPLTLRVPGTLLGSWWTSNVDINRVIYLANERYFPPGAEAALLQAGFSLDQLEYREVTIGGRRQLVIQIRTPGNTGYLSDTAGNFYATLGNGSLNVASTRDQRGATGFVVNGRVIPFSSGTIKRDGQGRIVFERQFPAGFVGQGEYNDAARNLRPGDQGNYDSRTVTYFLTSLPTPPS